ncbi:MAG TPA: 16S rRNA (cytidine(1402)-2'-O)-methyltransferase [Acidimicrobiia bacterium]|nr:16S rRNA (cytidine(1402)-2'-O)-methyltransferase [Acidimicrobiia bacterium]
MTTGRLIVCATPIGNLGDISERLRSALASADLVFAEDTRRVAKLLAHLGLTPPVLSLFTGNEQARSQQLLEAVGSGQTVALVSDAGTPVISDPGAGAVRSVREAGYAVSVIPGPSAVTSAVALSGFEGDRFVFEGFLPRRGAERADRLAQIGLEPRVVVLFASPNRLAADLEGLAGVSDPGRQVAVMRELTKVHEEVWVGTLEEAVSRWEAPVKGEVTVVLGPSPQQPPSLDDAVTEARRLLSEGNTVSEAARIVSEGLGVSRRRVYETLIRDQESS